MVVNIEAIKEEELLARTVDFEKRGGALLHRVYRISENFEGKKPADKYTSHLMVARQTIDKVNFEHNIHWNRCAYKGSRSSFPVYQTNFDELDHSGLEIGLEAFLGPFFDIELGKPILRSAHQDAAYFYDAEEIPENRIDIQQRKWQFENNYPQSDSVKNGYVKYAFIDAFLDPPYSVNIGESGKDRGTYLVDFMDFFFSDLDQLEIMTWSTNCSAFFEPGKEWWGVFFWTVYNPVKDWYVGICGSTTD